MPFTSQDVPRRVPAITTQEQHPKRATVRTVVQFVISTIITLGVVAPIVTAIIGEELGYLLGEHTMATIVAIGGVLAAIGGALARIMAIPGVDGWVEKFRIGSAPQVDDLQALTAAGRRSARVLPVDPPDAPEA